MHSLSFILVECGRVIPGHAKGTSMQRLIITDGQDEPLKGICVYFLRVNHEEEISKKNMDQVGAVGSRAVYSSF